MLFLSLSSPRTRGSIFSWNAFKSKLDCSAHKWASSFGLAALASIRTAHCARLRGKDKIFAFVFLLAVSASTYADSAQRIVTTAPHLAELVCAAGGCSRLVGVAAYTDYPASAAQLPQIADAYGLNVEPLLALTPDLVLTWDGGTPQSARDALALLSVESRSLRVRTLDDIATALTQIGGWLGTPAIAEAAAAEFRATLATLVERYSKRAPLRVLYQLDRQPIITINRDSPISQALGVCGGVNVFASMSQLAAPVSREAVMAANPDVIVFARQGDVQGIREDWARWPEIKAVREGHLLAVNADLLSRATPRMLDGISELCGLLDFARPTSNR